MPINNKEGQLEAKQNSAPEADRVYSRKKIAAMTAGLVLGGLAIGYVSGLVLGVKVILPYVYEQKTKQFFEELLRPYKEDFVGGATPEETIDLFISALKKEDYDLASKYFDIGQQKKAKSELDGRNLLQIIEELEYAKKNWHKEISAEDAIEFWYNKEGFEVSRDIVMIKNINNKWKISSINIYYLGF